MFLNVFALYILNVVSFDPVPKNKVKFLELLLLDHLYSEKYDNTNEIEKFV